MSGFCGSSHDRPAPAYSHRGFFLPTPVDGFDEPILTVECYSRWYSLYLVTPNGEVSIVDFSELEPYASGSSVSAYVDHVPNPVAVEAFAESRGYHLYEVALDMIVGRWTREVTPG